MNLFTNSIPLDALMKKLEETFDTRIDRNTSEREVLLKIGQEEVIDFIRKLNQEGSD